MSPFLAAALRMVLIDPYQAYDFECTLHRPSGQVLTVGGSIRGRSATSRVATVRGDPRQLAGGERLPVQLVFGNVPDMIEQEIFRTTQGGVDYVYMIDRSIPFEGGVIGMTLLGADLTQEDPVRLSAIGFCRTRDFAEEETNP